LYTGYLDEFFPTAESSQEQQGNTTTTTPNNACHDNGLYQNLWLDQNNLMGTLPEELHT
jgi:hypothetical protein